MRKIASLLLAALLLLACAACGEDVSSQDDGQTQIPNPIHESNPDEILNTYGFAIALPEGAQNATYSVVDGDDGFAQARFDYNGSNYTYRIQSANALTDNTGMYYEWDNSKDVEISYCSGKVCWNEGAEGICYYYDVVSSVLYSISTGTGASEQSLVELASALFVPNEGI